MRAAVGLGLAGALAFALAASWRLTLPGLYYDEVHQAVASFAYVGRPSSMFSLEPVAGLPLLNMPYSGALKSAVYGLYLRFTDRPFSIRSWRLLGIGFVATGILALAALAGIAIRPPTVALLLLLLLTDVDLLLQSRHDWGPVALSFLLRALFVGSWLRMESSSRRPAAWAFVLGTVTGLAVYEKLSALVLLLPLALILALSRARKRGRLVAASVAGALFGASPVLLANLLAWNAGRPLPALAAVSRSSGELASFVVDYLALGSGLRQREMMFESHVRSWSHPLEAFALAALLLLSLVALRTAAPDGADPSRPAIADRSFLLAALGAFAAIGIGLRCLPAQTAENHWILGTPFQALAIALAAERLFRAPRSAWLRASFALGLAALLAARLTALVTVVEATRAARFTPPWDPSVTKAASFLGQRPIDAVVIAADWGVATQVLCLANGRPFFVYEPFWDYRGPETLLSVVDRLRRESLWIAALRPRSGVAPEATRRIFEDAGKLEGWREIPLPVREFAAVEVRAFERVSAELAPIANR